MPRRSTFACRLAETWSPPHLSVHASGGGTHAFPTGLKFESRGVEIDLLKLGAPLRLSVHASGGGTHAFPTGLKFESRGVETPNVTAT